MIQLIVLSVDLLFLSLWLALQLSLGFRHLIDALIMQPLFKCSLPKNEFLSGLCISLMIVGVLGIVGLSISAFVGLLWLTGFYFIGEV